MPHWLDRLSTQSSACVSFVFAVFKRWSIANENAINIFYFFERVDNFVASYSCPPRTRKLNEGEIGILKVLSIKNRSDEPMV